MGQARDVGSTRRRRVAEVELRPLFDPSDFEVPARLRAREAAAKNRKRDPREETRACKLISG